MLTKGFSNQGISLSGVPLIYKFCANSYSVMGAFQFML